MLGNVNAWTLIGEPWQRCCFLAWSRRAARADGPTWGCGYVKPTARMQYTGRSFAEMIAEHLLPRFLRPHTIEAGPAGTVPIARAISDREYPDPVSEKVYEPFFRRWAERFSRLRILQQGKVHVYLVYIVLMVVLALAWVSCARWWGCVMSEMLVLLGIVIAASSGLPGLFLGRTSMGGQWVTTLLAVLGAALGLGGVGYVLGHGRQSADRAAVGNSRGRVQRGRGRAVGHLSAADLPDLAAGQHLRPGLLEADGASAERPQAAAVLRHADRRHGAAGDRPQQHPVPVRLGDHGAVGLLPGHHRRPRTRSSRNRLDLPGGDPRGDPVPVRPVRLAACRQRLVLAGAARVTRA